MFQKASDCFMSIAKLAMRSKSQVTSNLGILGVSREDKRRVVRTRLAQEESLGYERIRRG